ncbi:hypothetical protein [Candidatus Harpocratesius sp.]
MDEENIGKWVARLTIGGPIIFLILSTFAMLVYAGGNGVNPQAKGYNFLLNFFSDLGMWISYHNTPNYFSSIIFSLSVIIVGISLIPFFIYIPVKMSSTQRSKIFFWIGSFFGIIASLAYIGIGFTPWDKYLQAHLIFVFIAFPSSFPLAIMYIFGFINDRIFPKQMALYFVGCSIIILGYVYLLFFGPMTSTEIGRLIQVVSQKIVVYAINFTMLAEGIELLILLNKKRNKK